MKGAALLLALALITCTSAAAPDSLPAGEDPAPSAGTSGPPDDYHVEYRPGQQVTIGMSSRTITHLVTLDDAYALDAWAQWDRPYVSMRLVVTGAGGQALEVMQSPTLPDRTEASTVIGPGDYRIALTVFGAHPVHAFEMGGSFRAID